MKGKALLEKLPKSAIWLRDHCRCSECFHPTTKQRLVNVFDMDLGISFFNQTNGNLNVEWTDGHKSTYPMSMLKGFGSVSPKFTLWDSLFQPKPVEYEEIMHGDGLRKWISNIHRFGIGFVSGVPPNAEQSKELAEKLTFIRHTHYGGFWESTADLSI